MQTCIVSKPFFTLCFVLAAGLLASCEKDPRDPDTGDSGSGSAYLFSLRVLTSDGTADFVWKFDSLAQLMSGEIDVEGKGIEQAGWNYYFGLSNALFSVNYGEEGTIAYDLDAEGRIREKGSFFAERMDCMGKADEQHIVGVGAPWGGGSVDCEFMVINTDNVAITSRKFLPFFQLSGGDTLNRWPTGATLRDGKIFVPFYPLDGESWETPLMDSAYINVYSYPDFEYLSTLTDGRAAPIGMYGSQPCIIKTENGDIYTISTGSYASGYTQTGSPSGILRIKNGSMDFDDSYFLNFEEGPLAGRLIFGDYIGNGKALVRYIAKSLDDAEQRVWAATDDTKSAFKVAIVDLVSQTITPIDIPMHGGEWARQIFVENGKIYHSFTFPEQGETRIYQIDIATGQAVKGALVKGSTIPLIYKVTY